MVLVRAVVSQISQQVGFSEVTAHTIVVAIDEACTNVIRHCYKGFPDKRILLVCRVTETGLEFVLRDFGPTCDLEKIKSPETAGQKPGGLGLVLIKNVMDEVEFSKAPQIGLELRMFKRFPSS